MPSFSVGLIGVGNIGGGLARNLLRKGFPLKVYDIRRERLEPLRESGAQVRDGAAQLARECDVILLSLPTPTASREVILGTDGVLTTARPGSVLVEMSTLTPQIVREFAEAAGVRGVDFLDAPIMGGKVGAEKGTLQATIGGKENAFKQCQPIFEAFCRRIVHVGDVGAGQYVKLINNLMDVDALFLSIEAMVLAARAREETGLNLELFYTILEQGTAASWIWSTYIGNLMRNRPISALVGVLWKDAKLIAELERDKQVPHQSFQRTLGVASYYMSLGLGQSDFLELVRRVGEETGLDMFIHEDEATKVDDKIVKVEGTEGV